MSRPVTPKIVKFERGIASRDGCWIWRKPNGEGYGEFSHRGKHILAHRYSYETFKGPIPAGLEIDHRCRVRACVNPDHLRLLTTKQNVLCGEGITAKAAAATSCKRGHPFIPKTTKIMADGSRLCRTCANERARIYRLRRASR